MTDVRWFSSFRQSRWFTLVWVVPLALLVLVAIVVAAQWFRSTAAGHNFLASYPGASALPAGAPVGFPVWLEWQHGLNAFFILLIIRSGWQVRTIKRPAAYWTRRNGGVVRTKRRPVRISLTLWMHLSLDVLWVANGVLFYVLIFSTGQWVRIIPTRWDVFPNAVSAVIQYASLTWPVENGWANYNALQLLSYFVIVFIAAPVALITGLRMAPGLQSRFASIEKVFPITVARKLHFPTMVFFVVFIVVHVTLVLATGALNNLNHMYATRNDESWWGFAIFGASLVMMVAAWVAARPIVLRSIAGLGGTVGR